MPTEIYILHYCIQHDVIHAILFLPLTDPSSFTVDLSKFIIVIEDQIYFCNNPITRTNSVYHRNAYQPSNQGCLPS